MSDQHGDTHSPRQHIVLDNMVSFFLQVNMSLRFWIRFNILLTNSDFNSQLNKPKRDSNKNHYACDPQRDCDGPTITRHTGVHHWGQVNTRPINGRSWNQSWSRSTSSSTTPGKFQEHGITDDVNNFYVACFVHRGVQLLDPWSNNWRHQEPFRFNKDAILRQDDHYIYRCQLSSNLPLPPGRATCDDTSPNRSLPDDVVNNCWKTSKFNNIWTVESLHERFSPTSDSVGVNRLLGFHGTWESNNGHLQDQNNRCDWTKPDGDQQVQDHQHCSTPTSKWTTWGWRYDEGSTTTSSRMRRQQDRPTMGMLAPKKNQQHWKGTTSAVPTEVKPTSHNGMYRVPSTIIFWTTRSSTTDRVEGPC